MLAYDGEMTDGDKRCSLLMSLLADEGDYARYISQVCVDMWDNAINDCISSAHTVSAVDDSSGLIESAEFANALCLRGEIS